MRSIENFMNQYAPIVPRDDKPNEPGEVVGIISRKHRVVFVVSPHREDQRHGATTVTPMSDYWKAMYEAVTIR